MSILLETEEGWIISHFEYLKEIYSDYELTGYHKLFEINSQYVRDDQFKKLNNGILKNEENSGVKRSKKRKRTSEIDSSTAKLVDFLRHSFAQILTENIRQKLFSNTKTADNNAEARLMSSEFFKKAFGAPQKFYGCNNTDSVVTNVIDNVKYVFPNNCSFYSYDIREISVKLKENHKFDFILMDPPWWNKFVRRKREKNEEAGYKMMYNDELMGIPIDDLLSDEGIIAVWCTNSKNHNSDVIEKIFPAWGVKQVATWYWIKITQSGHPICDFTCGEMKQPYETLIFGAKIMNDESKIPDNKIIISVPSSVHSHKPPITKLMERYLRSDPKCIEFFARYLLPNWTSYGFEVLKFQHHWIFTTENMEKITM